MYDHNHQNLKIISILDDVFKKIKKCENGQENIKNFLNSSEAIKGLRGK